MFNHGSSFPGIPRSSKKAIGSRRPVKSRLAAIETLEARIAPATIAVNGGSAVSIGTHGTYTIDVSGGNLRVIDGASVTRFTTPVAAITSLVLNGEAADAGATGNDTFTVGSVTGFTGALTINGNTGNDKVNLNGSITFASGNSLDVDLLNDGGSLGLDTISVGANAKLAVSGAGSITLGASRNIIVAQGAELSAVDGNITLVANPTGTVAGNFDGIRIGGFSANAGANLRTTGAGNISLAGSGGDDTATATHYGVASEVGSNFLATGTGAIGIRGSGGDSYNGLGGVYLGSTGGSGSTEVFSNTGISIYGTIAEANVAQPPPNAAGTGGVSLLNNLFIHTSGSAPISIEGYSREVIGQSGLAGIWVALRSPGAIKTESGDITLTGAGSVAQISASITTAGTIATQGGKINLIGDHIGFTSLNAGTGNVTLRPLTAGFPIDLGAPVISTAGVFVVPDSMLDNVTAGSIIVGGANVGAITVSAALTPAAAGLSLVGGSGIAIQAPITLPADKSLVIDSTGVTQHLTLANGNSDLTTSGLGSITLTSALDIVLQGGSSLTSNHGNITLRANGNGAGQINSYAVQVGSSANDGGAAITTTGGGDISISGTVGAGSWPGATGVGIFAGSSVQATGKGKIEILGAGGFGVEVHGALASANGDIFLTADTMDFETPATIVATLGNVGLKPLTAGRQIVLGSAAVGSNLVLTDTDLDRITAQTVTIGDTNSGSVRISSEISPESYQTLKIDHALTLSGPAGFVFDVTSATVYERLVVTGALTITSAQLTVNSQASLPPEATFTFVENISNEATTGHFDGKNEGAVVSLGGHRTITYAGGTGNDVVYRAKVGAVSLAALPADSLGEDSGSAFVYRFNRTGDLSQPLTVKFEVRGTAAFGSDYTQTGAASFSSGFGTVTFPANAATVSISLSPTSDTAYELNETVSLTLAEDDAYDLGATSSYTGTIVNDDGTPLLSVSDASVVEGHTGTSAVVFTVTLSGETTLPVTLNYGTSLGTANITSDYDEVLGGTLTFQPGETSKTISIAVHGDSVFEANETFYLNLSNATNADFLVQQATGTILNDDAVPTISVADASASEGHSGLMPMAFTVTLSNPSSEPVTMRYSLENGTAISPGDYLPAGTYLVAVGTSYDDATLITFQPGETSKTIYVGLRGDTLYEGGWDETFFLNLSEATHATFADARAMGTILHDDAAPVHAFTLDAKHPVVFFDANHDKVLVKLTGKGTSTVSLVGDAIDAADISEILLSGADAKSSLSVAVKRAPGIGDGTVSIGEVQVDGGLGTFNARVAQLDGGGFVASGAVKTISLASLRSGEIMTGGVAADRLSLYVGEFFPGTVLDTPQSIAALTSFNVAGHLHAAAFGTITVVAGNLSAEIQSAGAIGRITVKTGSFEGDVTAASFGPMSVGYGDFIGSLTSTASAETLGKVAALSGLTISGGSFGGEIHTLGRIGNVTVREDFIGPGGYFGGQITARSVGQVTLVGGDFTGSITVLTPPETLGKTPALAGLKIVGGDLSGDLRLLGALGPVSVNVDRVGQGGGLLDATIGASSIASLIVTGDVIHSTVLAGADLGADRVFGGGDDQFTAGSMGAVSIKGKAIAAIIGAGLSTDDATLKDADDSIVGGVASTVKSLTIAGTADTDSYFATGAFKARPKIKGITINPLTDPRFKTI